MTALRFFLCTICRCFRGVTEDPRARNFHGKPAQRTQFSSTKSVGLEPSRQPCAWHAKSEKYSGACLPRAQARRRRWRPVGVVPPRNDWIWSPTAHGAQAPRDHCPPEVPASPTCDAMRATWPTYTVPLYVQQCRKTNLNGLQHHMSPQPQKNDSWDTMCWCWQNPPGLQFL